MQLILYKTLPVADQNLASVHRTTGKMNGVNIGRDPEKRTCWNFVLMEQKPHKTTLGRDILPQVRVPLKTFLNRCSALHLWTPGPSDHSITASSPPRTNWCLDLCVRQRKILFLMTFYYGSDMCACFSLWGGFVAWLLSSGWRAAIKWQTLTVFKSI